MNRLYLVFITIFVPSLALSQECLERVAKFAQDVCGEVVQQGSSDVFDARGRVTGEVGGIIRQFVGNAEASAEFERNVERYSNVLREHLPKELADVRQCRMEMVKFAREEACDGSTASTTISADQLTGWWQYKYDGDLQGDPILIYIDDSGGLAIENGSLPDERYLDVSLDGDTLTYSQASESYNRFGTRYTTLRIINDAHMIGSTRDSRGEAAFEFKRDFGEGQVSARSWCPEPIPAAKCERR